jgi:hypothetical protein
MPVFALVFQHLRCIMRRYSSGWQAHWQRVLWLSPFLPGSSSRKLNFSADSRGLDTISVGNRSLHWVPAQFDFVLRRFFQCAG